MTHYSVNHIGVDMGFHHPHGARLKLAPAIVERYEAEKEQAEIFTQISTAIAFSPVEILNWFLMQTKTSVKDHLPPEAQAQKCGTLFVTFPIRFKPGNFQILTEEGPVDLSHLKLMCKITITDHCA